MYFILGEPQCGKPPQIPRGRIIGGKEATKHSQPWMVSVIECRQCGGTLISDKHVLTASHCVHDKKRFRVILGDHNCDQYDTGEISIAVGKVSIHPKYARLAPSRALVNDIAVLTLDKPVKFSSSIQPACLPTSSCDDYIGHKVTAAGWGRIGENKKNEGNLMTLGLKVLPISECFNIIKSVVFKLMINSKMILVGKRKGDPDKKWMAIHKGDSGGN